MKDKAETKTPIQPALFRGVSEKVFTSEAKRAQDRAKRNRQARERRAEKMHR